MGIAKRWPINAQVRQLELVLRYPRRYAFNLMRHRGFVFLVAATVVVVVSLLIHPHLAMTLAPVATSLYALGVVLVQQQRKGGGVANPLALISLVQGRSAFWQKRPNKYSNRKRSRR